MKTTIEPTSGQIFVCVKNNKQHSAVKGKFYVYACPELRTYTKRSVTVLANGDEMLELSGVFERAETCPFCDLRIYDAARDMEVVEHDGEACAHAWDAKVKNYCVDCGADLEAGKCLKCEG